MRKERRTSLTIALSLFLSLLTAVSIVLSLGRVQAAQSAAVAIDAPPLVTQDGVFSATVNISGVANLDAASYVISFQPGVLELKDVTGGRIGGEEIPVTGWSGRFPGTATIVQNTPGVSGISGSGYLAKLTFHVIGAPSQSSNITISEGVLSDNVAQSIPAQWVGGLVRVTPHEQAAVTVAAGPMSGGGAFIVRILISQVDNLDAANYDVTFPPTALTVDNVTAGNINGVAVPVSGWSKSGGRVRVVQNIPGVDGVTGAGYLAEVHFRTVTTGSASIGLENGVLSDSLGLEIPATWTGGAVGVLRPGDATDDGIVNALDITKVERIIAHLDLPTPGADANQDGRIDALDITRVERMIAGLQ